MCTDGQVMTFDMVCAAVGSPVDFRGDESLVLPEFIRIDQSGVVQFVGNFTQCLIGSRADRKTGDRLVFPIQGICNPYVFLFTSDKGFELVYLIHASGRNMGRSNLSCDQNDSFDEGSGRYAIPLIPTPSLIYFLIVPFSSGMYA